MSFVTIEFLSLFGILLLLFIITPKKHFSVLMLIFSVLFYGYASINNLWLLLSIVVLGYLSARFISTYRRFAKTTLSISCTLHVGVIVWFKYGVDLISRPEVELTINSFGLSNTLPLGLSFYTLQSLGYVFDVYRRKIGVEERVWRYALFVSFFPQLIAGPIERAKSLAPQLASLNKLKYNNVISGCYLVLLGLFKKTVISNNINSYRESIVDNLHLASSFDVTLYPFAMLFWVYFDFSSYTDIARGIARVFGVSLIENFQQPLSAKTFRGFWNSWHVSLTKWLSDYVYIPMAKVWRTTYWRYFCTLFVFTLMGLWHSYSFILFFILNGVFVTVEHALNKYQKKSRSTFIHYINRLININAFVLLAICMTSFFYGVSSISDSLLLAKLFFSFGGEPNIIFLARKELFFGLTFGMLFELLSRKAKGNDNIIEMILNSRTMRWAYPVLILYVIAFLGQFGVSDFFYYGF